MKKIPIINLSSGTGRKFLTNLRSRSVARTEAAQAVVDKILYDVKNKGDSALFAYTKKFDHVSVTKKTIRLEPSYIKKRAALAPAAFKAACAEAAQRIRAFHERQRPAAFSLKTTEGVLSQVIRPIGRAGVYVPGGVTLYPSSVLMNVIPAQIAGVAEIALATPPRGELDPALAYAMALLGVSEAYRMGGAQAIAAFAYGTRSVAAVDKITGPGNLYVALAKKAVYGTVAIDSVAGPSEVIVLADASANPQWVALDLLAQAEHGSGDETALCVTEDARFATSVAECTVREIERSPVKNVFSRLGAASLCVCVAKSRKQSIEFVNQCAPEHLEIITTTWKQDLRDIRNAGAVFAGPYSPVAMGDYFAGTNHVLPTGGAARFSSPLGVEDFVKRMSVAEISRRGLRSAARRVSVLARAERFVHHALSVERRADA
ncbi:MAG TPA: histidinol dehydrogenase [Chitinivibrionales bacterium]|nr:histidinol dehydrogenase [Chitinivibrionales bacterium]